MSARDLVLLADDEPLSREFLQEALQSFGCEVRAVADGAAAIAALGEQAFDLVVTDLRMPHQDGMAVLAAAKKADASRPVVLVTAHGTMHTAVTAMRQGADDVLEKPVGLEDLELLLTRMRERRRLLRENGYLRREAAGGELVAASVAMQQVVMLAERVAPSTATVLIHGETGTGKERIAARIHAASDRADKPFVKLNCAAIPEALLESELFGHEAGGGHRHQGSGARVDVDDAGADLHAVGDGGEVAQLGDRVVRVRLGDPDDVETDLFQLDDLLSGRREVPDVVDHHRQFHGDAFRLRSSRCYWRVSSPDEFDLPSTGRAAYPHKVAHAVDALPSNIRLHSNSHTT